MHVFTLRQPEAWHLGLTETLPQHLCRHLWIGEERHQAFATRLIWNGRDDTGVRFTEQSVDRLFDLDMRDHLTTELAEARQPVGDSDETMFVHRRHVTGHIPAIADDLSSALRIVQVPSHPVWPLDQQQSFTVEQRPFERLRIEIG